MPEVVAKIAWPAATWTLCREMARAARDRPLHIKRDFDLREPENPIVWTLRERRPAR